MSRKIADFSDQGPSTKSSRAAGLEEEACMRRFVCISIFRVFLEENCPNQATNLHTTGGRGGTRLPNNRGQSNAEQRLQQVRLEGPHCAASRAQGLQPPTFVVQLLGLRGCSPRPPPPHPQGGQGGAHPIRGEARTSNPGPYIYIYIYICAHVAYHTPAKTQHTHITVNIPTPNQRQTLS